VAKTIINIQSIAKRRFTVSADDNFIIIEIIQELNETKLIDENFFIANRKINQEAHFTNRYRYYIVFSNQILKM
jgi:hypothetical protein